MIGNLLSNVLSRKTGEIVAVPPTQPVVPASPAAAPPDPAADSAALAGAQAASQAAAEAAARQEFLQRKEYERAMAQVWLQSQLLLHTLRADPALADPRRLEKSGWKAYSQNDEDGILAEIFRRIGAVHKSFVEFGCGDGLENNTAYLLAQGWRGLWMDGDDRNSQMIGHGFGPLIEHGLLQFRCEFITRDNIDGLIAAAGLGDEIDLLSIDLDGNDYYLWEAINCISPRVVVAEYNAKFQPPFAWRIAYNAKHAWQGDDYAGVSLSALEELGRRKGYRLVGCNLSGVNAFFVRQDLAGDLFASPATAAHLFQPARYDLVYGYRGGHGASSLSIVQGASDSAGLGVDIARVGATYKPEIP